MPDLEINGVGTIEVGEDFKSLSPEQQNAFVQNVIGQIQSKEQPTSERPQQSQEPDFLDRTYFGKALKGAGQFAMGLPTGLGNLAVGATQAVTDVIDPKAKSGFSQRLAEEVARRKGEQSQLPTAEKIGILAGEQAPFLTTGVGTGRAVAGLTGSKIAGLAAGGAVGTGVPEIISQQTEPGLENRVGKVAGSAALGAGIGAGLGTAAKLGSAVAGGAKELGKDIIQGYKARPAEAIAGFTNKPIQTLDEVSQAIKDKSSAIYNAMRETNATLKPKATSEIFSKIEGALDESGILNKRLHGDTMGVVSDLKELAKSKKGKVSLEELDQYRQLLGDVVKKNTDIAGKLNADGVKANIAINRLDDVVENLKPELISGGKQSIDLLNEARQEWKRYRKFDSVANIVKKADGDPNRIKTLMQNFVNNSKNLRGFSEAERNALKEASRNSTGEGLLKAVGKFGFDLGSGRNIGNAALPVGSILIGGSSGGTVATIGTLARQAQKLSARGKVEDVLKLIEGQSPEVSTKVINKLPIKQRDLILMNLLSRSIDSGSSNQIQNPESQQNITQ